MNQISLPVSAVASGTQHEDGVSTQKETSGGTPRSERLIRLPLVMERCGGISRSLVYQLMAKGSFPRPVQLSPRSVAWRESEVDAFIASRVRKEPSSSEQASLLSGQAASA